MTMETLNRSTAQIKINVLDYGHVDLVDYMGSDLSVVNAARVSFNKESSWDYADSHVPSPKLPEKDAKLIKYLGKHNHFTPFCHPQITLRIKCPIFVRAQLGKHQIGLTMNEVSRRYVTFEPEIYTPLWRNAPTDGASKEAAVQLKIWIFVFVFVKSMTQLQKNVLTFIANLFKMVLLPSRQDQFFPKELIRNLCGLVLSTHLPVFIT